MSCAGKKIYAPQTQMCTYITYVPSVSVTTLAIETLAVDDGKNPTSCCFKLSSILLLSKKQSNELTAEELHQLQHA